MLLLLELGQQVLLPLQFILFILVSVCIFFKQGKADEMNKPQFDMVFEQGDVNPYSQFFTGTTYLNMLNAKDDIFNTPLAGVTFEPLARTHWHKHSGGQILLILNGEGYYQEKGKDKQIIRKGDVVRILPNVEHWHGAGLDTWMTHISLESNGAINQVTWLDAVKDEEYRYK